MGVQYVGAQAAPSWTAPVSAPPASNTYSPLNVSSSGQTKAGGLTLGSTVLTGSPGLIVPNGTAIFGNMRFTKTPADCLPADCSSSDTNYIQSGGTHSAGSWVPLYFAPYSNNSSTAKVGIGTSAITQLEVFGNIKIHGATGAGEPGEGKVLTSDAVGRATWRTLAAGSGGTGLPTATIGQTLRHNGTTWIADSFLFNNGTKVGIGTSNPSKTLDVNGPAKIGGAGGGLSLSLSGANSHDAIVITNTSDDRANLLTDTSRFEFWASSLNRRADIEANQITLSGGSPANDKVLTATNSGGSATWQTPSISYTNCTTAQISSSGTFGATQNGITIPSGNGQWLCAADKVVRNISSNGGDFGDNDYVMCCNMSIVIN